MYYNFIPMNGNEHMLYGVDDDSKSIIMNYYFPSFKLDFIKEMNKYDGHCFFMMWIMVESDPVYDFDRERHSHNDLIDHAVGNWTYEFNKYNT